MLNCEDIEQLKIQALMEHASLPPQAHYFSDLLPIFSQPSSEHVIIKNTSNSNILAFCYVLLTQIFDQRVLLGQPGSSGHSSPANTGSGSKVGEKGQTQNSDNKNKDPLNDANIKLERIYSFLSSSKINLGQIVNLPHPIQKVINESFKNDGKNHKNLVNNYLKKMLVQFFKILRSTHSKRSNSKGGNSKQFYIAAVLQKYSVCEALLSAFIRCILFFEYEIAEALDYNRQISDHTVYTALCDAFQFTSLKIQQNYTQIIHGSFIRLLRVKNNNDGVSNFYLISLPQCKCENFSTREIDEIDTFRIRRKSSDNTSNNDGSPKQNTRKKSNQNKKQPENQITIQKKVSANPEQNAQKVQNQNKNMIANFQAKFRVPNQKKEDIKQKELKLQKSLSEHIIMQQKSKTSLNPETNGYTSLQILKQLSPKVRQSMLKSINYYKNVNI